MLARVCCSPAGTLSLNNARPRLPRIVRIHIHQPTHTRRPPGRTQGTDAAKDYAADKIEKGKEAAEVYAADKIEKGKEYVDGKLDQLSDKIARTPLPCNLDTLLHIMFW